MNDQNFKNLCLNFFYFCKILKVYEKNNKHLQNFLYCTQEDDHR